MRQPILNIGNKAGLTQTKYREQAGMTVWKASVAKLNNGENGSRKVDAIYTLYIPWVLTRE